MSYTNREIIESVLKRVNALLGINAKLLFMVVLAMMFGTINSQSVKRQGNVFIEQRDTTFVNNGTKTQYTYKAKDGKEYPIYLSKNGKAYIVRVSKKSGKQYKQYLPKVTEQLNTSAK